MNAWKKLAGKSKFVVAGLYVLLCAGNKLCHLGLDEDTLNRIAVAFAAVLGADMAEGIAANFGSTKK